MNPPDLTDGELERDYDSPLTEEELAELAQAEAEENAEAVGELDLILEELERAKLERDELKQQVLRAYADLQNFRKHSQQRLAEVRKEATESVVLSLIPALDNFERTLRALADGATVESAVEGVQMIERQFQSVLNMHQVQRISVVGEMFDPIQHEAISSEPNGEVPEGTILSEVAAGYRLGDAVIRPAKVIVAGPAS